MTEYAYSRKLDSISEETSMLTIRSVLSSSTSGVRVAMGLLRCPRGILPRRIGQVAEARRGLAGSDDPVDLVLEGVAVGAPDPGHDRRQVLRPRRVEALEREAVSQDLLHGVQLADRYAADPLRSVRGELAVDHRIVLAVVTDEQPRDLREVARELPQRVPLVLETTAEPAGVRRPPVREQQGTGWESLPVQEPHGLGADEHRLVPQ